MNAWRLSVREFSGISLAGRDATVFDAMAAFEDRIHAGKVLDAISVTNGGKETEAPIGIVTVSDVPVGNWAIGELREIKGTCLGDAILAVARLRSLQLLPCS